MLGATAVILFEPERHAEIRGLMERHDRSPDLAGEFGKYGVHLVRSRAGRGHNARNLAVQRGGVDAEPGVDVVLDVPRVGMAGELAGVGRPGVAGMQVLDIAQGQPFQAERHIAAGKVFDNAVEAPAAFGVVAGFTHFGEPFRVHQFVEFRPRRIEQRQIGEILRRGSIGVEPVGEPDPVDDAALDQGALIHLGIQFERGDADVPAHRLPVNDRPARRAEPVDEMRAQCQ